MANAYSTGAAASFSDLRTAMETFLVANGWIASAGAGTNRLWKRGAMAIEAVVTGAGGGTKLYFNAGTDVSGTALVNLLNANALLSPAGAPITFPLTYEFYWYDTGSTPEFYCVIGFNGNKYQHVHWGLSDVPGIGGTGMWIDGSYVWNNDPINTTTLHLMYMSFSRAESTGAATWFTTPSAISHCGGYFSNRNSNDGPHGSIHLGLDGSTAWRSIGGTASAAGTISIDIPAMTMLLNLPSYLNETEVLVPVTLWTNRPSSLYTPVATMRNARKLRIDNVNPGDILTYGSEQWKVYALYAKNSAQRMGVTYSTGAQHSGTYGVALRVIP